MKWNFLTFSIDWSVLKKPRAAARPKAAFLGGWFKRPRRSLDGSAFVLLQSTPVFEYTIRRPLRTIRYKQ